MRKSIISIPKDGLTWLIPARTIAVTQLEAKLPPCAWCGQVTLEVLFDITQHGFFSNQCMVICGCVDCQCATIFKYDVFHTSPIAYGGRDE